VVFLDKIVGGSFEMAEVGLLPVKKWIPAFAGMTGKGAGMTVFNRFLGCARDRLRSGQVSRE